MRLISSSQSATRRRASFTAFSSLFMPIPVGAAGLWDYIRLYDDFLCVLAKKAAIVWRIPQTFDHLWHSTISSPLGSHATLRHLILFGGDSTPFTKRSQHFATESTFHRNVNISPQRQVKIFQPFHYRVDFFKIEINFNIRCRVLTSRWNVHTSNMKKNERQYLT